MANNNEQWWLVHSVDKLDTPALVIYPERVKHNVAAAIQMVGDPSRLRPHIKTNKSAEAVQLMLDAGIRQFKCSTIAEAELLGRLHAPDVLLAYQPVGPKQHRLFELMKAYPATSFSCLVDNEGVVEQLAALANAEGRELGVWLDLNVGMNRTGIEPGAAALALYKQMLHAEGLNALGFHAYDGHIRDTDLSVRQAKVEAAFAPVMEMQDAVEKSGYARPIVIAGGSPSFPVHARRLDEVCSPGTFIYWDKGYGDRFPEQPFLPAALVVTRVISLPGAGRITTDLGHKSIAAENDLVNRVGFLNAPELVPVGQSEEHLVLDAGQGHGYKVGDVLYGVPYHVCPTIALYQSAYTIIDHEVAGQWKTVGRDRFLTV
ncbi:D-TA family PLP-dependent enzyme [Flavihumibacter rivuli]|uniref:D-TA family PLP-dependent enzyme n=1 Tax=Flavihumibacter rivuli TaxID=2838156 RepID=UPI001BDF4EC2|nr:D-TA family PLP-dependent enzyme [Flavihumibacter rivuli]ULQ56909.1 D-TA family PLP-dependent enzyme [Flavihumibacter rivuli]